MSDTAGAAPHRLEGGGAATDPGRVDVVESLYRGADGAHRRPSALRPFQPALRPPEGSQDYSWLYRPAEPAAAPTALLPAEPVAFDDPTGPTTRWSRAEPVPVRRWPALGLLGLALAGAALLALLGAAG